MDINNNLRFIIHNPKIVAATERNVKQIYFYCIFVRGYAGHFHSLLTMEYEIGPLHRKVFEEKVMNINKK